MLKISAKWEIRIREHKQGKSLAKQLLSNGRFTDCNKEHALAVKQETSALWQAPGVDGFLSGPFSTEELTFSFAINQLKSGKAQGPDNIPPQFIMKCGPRGIKWLGGFFNNCMSDLQSPRSGERQLLSPYLSLTSRLMIQRIIIQFRSCVSLSSWQNVSSLLG